jgi:hypothetical protein
MMLLLLPCLGLELTCVVCEEVKYYETMKIMLIMLK